LSKFRSPNKQLFVQSLIPNVKILVYLLALPNVACKKLVVPFISIPLTKNVMEQNLIGFPNSMYIHGGPYPLYFGYGYRVHKECSYNVDSYV
jgi:hypothetical protein